IEVATIPLLTSPGFILKRFQSLQLRLVGPSSRDSDQWSVGGQPDTRWLLYLLVLSANRLSSCAHLHQKSKPTSAVPFACCHLRHIGYTSLSTVLDLLTTTRAYLITQQQQQPPSTPAREPIFATVDGDLPIPSL